MLEAIRLCLKEDILMLTLTLPISEGRIRHQLYQCQAVKAEHVSEQGEYVLSVQIDQVKWQKLCHHHPNLLHSVSYSTVK